MNLKYLISIYIEAIRCGHDKTLHAASVTGAAFLSLPKLFYPLRG